MQYKVKHAVSSRMSYVIGSGDETICTTYGSDHMAKADYVAALLNLKDRTIRIRTTIKETGKTITTIIVDKSNPFQLPEISFRGECDAESKVELIGYGTSEQMVLRMVDQQLPVDESKDGV